MSSRMKKVKYEIMTSSTFKLGLNNTLHLEHFAFPTTKNVLSTDNSSNIPGFTCIQRWISCMDKNTEKGRFSRKG